MKKQLLIALGLAVIFFAAGIVTLPHYGINWDTINHLPRGQAYLHFFLTGNKDYSDLPKLTWYWQKPESLGIDTVIPRSEVPRRSMYQHDSTTFTSFMIHDGEGHPPLSDIFASVFNRVFFGQLRLINDIDSYRIYGVLLSAILVGLIYWWVSKVYGSLAGFFASVSLALYPLFWAESHFNNEKDIPVTVYWSLMIFSIWRGITKKNWKWLIAAGIFSGFALGSKFNIVFSIFVVLPWLAVYLLGAKNRKKINFALIVSFLLIPAIAVLILVGTWPYLWPDLVARIGGVINFYKGVGFAGSIGPEFAGPFGISIYPILWIIYTTPLAILFLSLLGIASALYRLRFEKDRVSLLLLLWLLVPIVRVTWPGASVYGGIRQIMEYIPALAIFSGLGANVLYQKVSTKMPKKLTGLAIALPFVFLTLNLVKIHPNENVFFNPLIGGLSGAKERNFPYWGFSFGAPYRQAAQWINEHAEEGSKMAFSYELLPNIPKIFLRTDLTVHNSFRSGYLRKGEYVVGLVYQGTAERSYYEMYLERFLEPVYQVMVDDVAILKIWKNNEEHLKLRWGEEAASDVRVEKETFGLRFDLGEVKSLSRLEVKYQEKACLPLSYGLVRVSVNGEDWDVMPESLPENWRVAVLGEQPKDGLFIEPFIGQMARYIELHLSPQDTCLNNIVSSKVFYFTP